MKYFKDDNGEIRAIEKGQEFLIKSSWQEMTETEVQSAINPPKSTERIIAEFEFAVERHVNNVAKSKGYNNIDSIAKYLGSNNAFRAECEALSAWTADVWITAQGMLNDWQAGTIEQPTIDEVIAALPAAPA